jgi:uncharacterized protein (DUF433 family)
MTSEHPSFEGIYDAPDIARYLLAARMANELYPVSSRSLIRWVRSGLALPSLKEIPGRDLLLTFEDMISMRVIAALRAYGAKWSEIHSAEWWLRRETGHTRPFATEQLWTANSEVFASFRDRIVSASRHGQLAFDIITDYLIPISGLRFKNAIARVWEPRSMVELNPIVQFGAPVVAGTSIPTRAIWGMTQAGDSFDMVARAYRITNEEVQAAVDWENDLAA